MKKALILILTMTMLLNTVAFAAMVVPSTTSPQPLSEVNLSEEMFYQEINSYYPDDAYLQLNSSGEAYAGSVGTNVGTTVYRNYLVAPVMYSRVMDSNRNKIDIYDLSSNDAYLIDTWSMEDLGWNYRVGTDGTTPDNSSQDNLTAMHISGDYIYLVKRNVSSRKQELYIYTNPLNDENYAFDPTSYKPQLVSGPTEISSQNTNETYLRGRLAQITKIDDYIIFAMAKTPATGKTVSYVDVSDPEKPTTYYYDTQSLLSYVDSEGETVVNAGQIMNVEFKGNFGYFVVSDTSDGSAKWDLVKVDFKYATTPKAVAGVELALPEKSNANMQWGATIYVTDGYVYVATRSESDYNQPSPAPLLYVVNNSTMTLVSSLSTNYGAGIGDMYDTGDMLICTSGSLRGNGGVNVLRLNENKTEIEETQVLSVPNNAIKNLQAHCFNIQAYGTKLYLSFGDGNLNNNAADAYRATIGVIDLAAFQPYTFTVNSVPSVANDSYTVTGSIYTPSTAGEVGVHLYIDGSTVPVTAEITPSELGFAISTWGYTFDTAGTYNVVAKLYDMYGDYENMTEKFKVVIKSTTGINAATDYVTIGNVTANSIPDKTETIDYTGAYAAGQSQASVGVVGFSTYGKYLVAPMVNAAQNASENNNRNIIYFYDTTAENPLATPVKAYNHAAMGLDKNNAWGVESNPRMIGAMVDDDYMYVLASKVQNYQYNAIYLYVYKNPIDKITGEFADTLEKLSETEVLDSNNVVKIDTVDKRRYTELKKITKDGKDYLIISYPIAKASTVADEGISKITVADVTDGANVSLTDINMSTITHNGMEMTYFYDLKFDGNYGYVVGANDGVLNTANSTLTGAYFVLYKVDFSNPVSPGVVNSWKICDINYEWLFRAAKTSSVRTLVVPNITINDGKVLIGIYHTEGFTDTSKQNTGLGSMNAYVLENDILTEYAANAVNVPTLKASTTMQYGTRQLNYVNGAYFALRYLSENGYGSNYFIGTKDEILGRATSAGAANTLQTSTTTGEPICSIVIGNKLYQNYYGRNEAIISCFDFEEIKPDNKVLTINSNEDYFAIVTVENNGVKMTGVPVAGLYKNGRLITATVGEEMTFDANSTVKSEKLKLSVPKDTDYSDYIIKTFLFSDMTEIRPLVQSMSITD